MNKIKKLIVFGGIILGAWLYSNGNNGFIPILLAFLLIIFDN